MRRRRKRSRDGLGGGFSLSFLDAISCGFGAIVILLVLTKLGEPRALEEAHRELQGRVLALEQELHEIRGETRLLDRRLKSRVEQLSRERQQIARLQGDLSRIRGQFAATRQLSEVQEIVEGRLLAAQQSLSEEMKRLLSTYRRPKRDALVGGIPVDSEYVIFVIDTSGSMVEHAWPLVVQKMRQVLDAYPKVKGVQVMNDMGQYMFSGYAGKWIPDTPGRRRVILQRLAGWKAFSNSSPVEGIERAIRAFASGDERISIYVFGDEFTGPSIEDVLETVARINRRDEAGRPRVRIHAVGFPTIFTIPNVAEATGIRFATLMRALCQQNAGTFVGLNATRP
ncbi:MAG: VWA domain-containing protein [Acidobacteria bacterium]|nr:MAG: VWA domain-containing protein [Acidobacteriota bacterium]